MHGLAWSLKKDQQMQYQLKIAGKHFNALQQHLFPGDGKEAVAVALCGRHEQEGLSILLTHKIELIPHNECYREEDFIRWKTDRIIPLIEQAERYNMAILKIHSHPGGYIRFSEVDDRSDNELFTSIFGWCDGNEVHGSAIMLPCGKVFGRVFNPELQTFPLNKVSVAGDLIHIWHSQLETASDDFALRTRQTFGEGTYALFKNLKVGVIGASGTGSPTIEQLVRLGVGHIVIIDPDKVELKNLNRILNTIRKDATNAEFKVSVISKFIENLYDSKDALHDLITCDAIFGCVDSVDGRHLVNQLTNFYLVPYFDLGVKLGADGQGGIDYIVASIHYIQPGASSLLSRGLYTAQRLFEEGLRRQDPAEFSKRLKAGYVHNADVESPAVISVNMQISSMAINELLNRLHPFKDDPAGNYARVMMDYCGGNIENVAENSFDADPSSVKWVGRGDCKPFLRMTELQ
jgi:hypothetical protein